MLEAVINKQGESKTFVSLVTIRFDSGRGVGCGQAVEIQTHLAHGEPVEVVTTVTANSI